MSSVLSAKTRVVTDKISIVVPTVGQILDDEQAYFSLATSLSSIPFDMKVQLDDIGVDYESITEYQLFLSVFSGLKESGTDTSLIFGDLDLSKFRLATKEGSEDPILYDEENDIVIDEFVQFKIAETLREINSFEKSTKKAANKSAKKYLIELERKKQKRLAKQKKGLYLENLVSALVNQGGFKYNFETVMDVSIYKLNISFKALRKYMNFKQTMQGYYSGNVDISKVPEDTLNWVLL